MSVFINKRNGSYLFLELQMPNRSHFIFLCEFSLLFYNAVDVRVHVTVYVLMRSPACVTDCL